MNKHNLLTAQELCCIRQHKPLFAQLSFALKPGQALLVQGENGTGKSSLLALLAGFSHPVEGDIFWQDQSIQHIKHEFWQHLHYLGHRNGLKLNLSVLENIMLMQHLTLKNPDESIDQVLDRLQLTKEKNTLALHLSAGQKRRLALAKLYLFKKTCWILDEPLTSLDAQTQTLFLKKLKMHLSNDGIAIITSHQALATNDLDLQTLRLDPC